MDFQRHFPMEFFTLVISGIFLHVIYILVHFARDLHSRYNSGEFWAYLLHVFVTVYFFWCIFVALGAAGLDEGEVGASRKLECKHVCMIHVDVYTYIRIYIYTYIYNIYIYIYIYTHIYIYTYVNIVVFIIIIIIVMFIVIIIVMFITLELQIKQHNCEGSDSNSQCKSSCFESMEHRSAPEEKCH